MAKRERFPKKRDEIALRNHRSCKLQEFEAHESNVSCLALGHMSGKVLVTGGYDQKVNLWALGTSPCVLSLNAHTSPVECVKFGHTEELVCSGSQAGELNIWDLDASKKVRTFGGHNDAIKSLDFHPYGDFLTSGSLDTTIKLWDLRRKGCLSTYPAHTLTVNRVRFSPDGIWIASAGEDGLVKLWDVRMGRKFAEFANHAAAVLTVEFHPHEFLLASGSMDRTVQFQDLDNLTQVSSTPIEPLPIRCLRFSPDGHCLYAGVEDHLKVYVWEPGRLLDTANIGWGNVQDMVQTSQQLVGASFHKTKVRLFAVDLQSVKTKPDPVPVSSGFPVRSANVRKSFSKEKLLPGTFSIKPNMDEDENKPEPTAPFQPQRTLNRTPPPSLPEREPSPPTVIEPVRPIPIHRQPSPSSEHEPMSLNSLDSTLWVGNSSSPHSSIGSPRSPSPKQRLSPLKPRRNSTSEMTRRASVQERTRPVPAKLNTHRDAHHESDNEFPLKMNNIRHCPSEPSLSKIQSRPRKVSQGVQAEGGIYSTSKLPGPSITATPLSSIRQTGSTSCQTPQVRQRPVHPVRPSPAASPAYFTPPQSFSKEESPSEEVADRLGGVNIEDFLPKNSLLASSPYSSDSAMHYSESDGINSLIGVHNSIMLALSSRQRNLQIVLSMWHTKDARAAIESAVSMKDHALITDLLGVLVLRPTLWTLDICGSILPALEDLLQSKYESYMTIGCSSLSLILRNFAHIIKNNILAPVHTMGVDISREERYNKSFRCYQHLISIRAFLLKRQTLPGKLGQSFREVVLLMENLEN